MYVFVCIRERERPATGRKPSKVAEEETAMVVGKLHRDVGRSLLPLTTHTAHETKGMSFTLSLTTPDHTVAVMAVFVCVCVWMIY